MCTPTGNKLSYNGKTVEKDGRATDNDGSTGTATTIEHASPTNNNFAKSNTIQRPPSPIAGPRGGPYRHRSSSKKNNNRQPMQLTNAAHLSMTLLLGFMLGCLLVNFEKSSVPEEDKSGPLRALRETYVSPAPQILPPKHVYNSPAKFVFTIGLEGTGHHLMADVLKNAPVIHDLESMKVFPQMSEKLISSLFAHPNSHEGLWSAHCDHQADAQKPADPIKLFNTVVANLQDINNQIKQENHQQHQQISVPVNSAGTVGIDAGVISYPNHAECHALNYPNLDVFYSACAAAKVDCEHIYLYRDVHDIIASTQAYDTRVLAQLQLYTTQLSVIYTQLSMHNDKTLGCVGLFDNDHDDLMKLYGWESKEQYDSNFEKVFKPDVKKVTAEEKLKYVPQDHNEFLVSMESVHNKVLTLCQTQVEQNKERNVIQLQ